MQKWEYLVVIGVDPAGGTRSNPTLGQFTESGLIRTRIDKVAGEDARDTVAKKIAQLGNEGWELVNIVEHCYHFKRINNNTIQQ